MARRAIIGGYYATEAQLFLTGHPQDHKDLRLMIFRVERPAGSQTGDKLDERGTGWVAKTPLVFEQDFYRGQVAGVNWINSIFASRCALVRERRAKVLLAGRRLGKEWHTLVGEKDLAYITSNFPDVANYLTNEPPPARHLPRTRMTHMSPDA